MRYPSGSLPQTLIGAAVAVSKSLDNTNVTMSSEVKGSPQAGIYCHRKPAFAVAVKVTKPT